MVRPLGRHAWRDSGAAWISCGYRSVQMKESRDVRSSRHARHHLALNYLGTRPYSTAPLRQMTKDDLIRYETGEHESLKTILRTQELELVTVHDYAAPHLGVIKVMVLNDSSSYNALGRKLVAEMHQVLESIHAQGSTSVAGDKFARVLIVASGMDKAFCAGAHLKERKTMTEEETRRFMKDMHSMMNRLETLPVPSIAAVNGAALGGGLELALRTHIRVFASNAVVGLPETRLGILPGAGGTYRLPYIIGKARALDLALTGRRIKAAEALQLGLCTHVAASGSGDEKGAVLREALRVAANISLGGPKGTKGVLDAMTFGEPSAERELQAYDTVISSKDRDEALKAFAEKRVPCFSGE